MTEKLSRARERAAATAEAHAQLSSEISAAEMRLIDHEAGTCPIGCFPPHSLDEADRP